jgi:hypothetical protein
MQQAITELETLISGYSLRFSKIPPDEFTAKPNPKKWSKQEVLGHLIDSAHNNLRRFIVGQYSQNDKIVYEQDFWNDCNQYNSMAQGDVITLWVLMNKRIFEVLRNMPADKYGNLVDTGKGSIELKSLQWLAEDYIKHMKHHINQVIPGSFDIIYP